MFSFVKNASSCSFAETLCLIQLFVLFPSSQSNAKGSGNVIFSMYIQCSYILQGTPIPVKCVWGIWLRARKMVVLLIQSGVVYNECMLKEMFLGKNPSSFHFNPAVKAFIISESFLWPAWNFLVPILAIFVVDNLPGGKIETAGFAYSIYLITRVIFELISGKILTASHTSKKITYIMAGICIVTLSYLSLALTQSILHFYISMSIAGIGFGMLSPAKNSLFSTHLDKDKESLEWGITDATVFIAIALAAALGGLIASTYGFQVLFILAACVNLLAILPYALYLYRKHM